jgi:hypothetical protein
MLTLAALETRTSSTRAGVRKSGFVFLVSTSGEPNHPPDLFFHEPFIPQLRDCHTSRRGIEGLPGQGHELMWVLFIAEDECDKEPVLNVLPTHDAMLCT